MAKKEETSTQREGRNNRRFYYILVTVLAILGIFGFVETRIDSKIENHPKVVEMKTDQENMDKQLDRMEQMLKELDNKVDRLLMEHP